MKNNKSGSFAGYPGPSGALVILIAPADDAFFMGELKESCPPPSSTPACSTSRMRPIREGLMQARHRQKRAGKAGAEAYLCGVFKNHRPALKGQALKQDVNFGM